MRPVITCGNCGLTKPHRSFGLCSACYTWKRKHGTDRPVKCSRPKCQCYPALADLGICKGHITDELSSLPGDEFESRIAEAFSGQFTIVGECWEFTGGRERGYGRIAVSPAGERRNVLVHHLVVQYRTGRLLAGDEFALHHCDNRPCFRPSHLYKGSLADNAADAVARNRTARGDRNPHTKLKPEQIREIFARYKPGLSQWDRGNAWELAQEFGVDKATITHLIRNGHWSLPGATPSRSARPPVTRLTPEQAREIAARHRPGFTRWDRGNTAQLAQEFGVHKTTIGKLAREGRESLREAS